jgi:hypothetical protein
MTNSSRVWPATLSMLLVLAFINNAFSQAGGETKSPPARVSARPNRARRGPAAKQRTKPQAPAPVAHPGSGQPRYVNSSVENYTFRQDSNTPLKVFLAPLGQVIIESPVNDPVYKVHPSKEDFVAVDRLDDDSLPTDPIVLRPGTGFRVARKGEITPATIVNLQMYSGAIIPVIVIPVNEIERNTLRVAITYDRDQIERSRQAAGLPIKLEQLQQKEAALLEASRNPKTVAVQPSLVPSPQPSIASPTAAENLSPDLNLSQASVQEASYTLRTQQATNLQPQQTTPGEQRASNALRNTGSSPALAPSFRPTPSPERPPISAEKLMALTRDELISVVRSNTITKFPKARHGLSIASSPSREIDAQSRIVVVAVRNTLNEPVRLVPGQPEITVEILDDKKRLVDTRDVARLYLQTTIKDNVLAAGETGYFALVFHTPILGTHEYLRARVAQVFAADAPVIVDLVISAR